MVLIVEKEIILSLCVVLSHWYLSVSFHTRTHTLTHAQTHVYMFWNTGLPTRSHTFAYTHTHTCTWTRGHAYVHTHAYTFTCTYTHIHTHTHNHYLVPTNTVQLIFCFEDCFLNQIKAFLTHERAKAQCFRIGRTDGTEAGGLQVQGLLG